MPRPAVLAARRWETPAQLSTLFPALARTSTPVFWLDGGDEAQDGWSFLGVGVPETDLDDVRSVHHDSPAPAETSCPPMQGGWVGWWDYESGAAQAGAPVAVSDEVPGWIRVERAIAVNHGTGEQWLLAADGDLDPWADELSMLVGEDEPREVPYRAATVVAHARHTPAEYRALINRARAHIHDGNAYQLCLTTRFDAPGEHDAVAAYLRLRRATPAHHGGFIRIGERAVLSASPEVFLRTDGDRVFTHPIKGTRPRGRTTAEDAALAAELHASEKERAENVMIVDLMRNDLSRVSERGSIRVDALWQVQSYSAVHQLVSAVSGRPRNGTTVGDLLEASFPAGSMTGAPKLSAMTILHDLEGGPRGVYSGCFGRIGVAGDLDLAMVIRSIVVTPEGASVGAGGGITWLSEPDAEVAEVAVKARAGLHALGARLPDAWDG